MYSQVGPWTGSRIPLRGCSWAALGGRESSKKPGHGRNNHFQELPFQLWTNPSPFSTNKSSFMACSCDVSRP